MSISKNRITKFNNKTSFSLALMMLLFLTTCYPQSPGGVNTNLQLWLKADSGWTSSIWSDQSGNGRSATATGSPTASGSINFNPTVSLNGTTTYYSVAHAAALNQNGSNQITLVAVANTSSGTYSTLVRKSANSAWDEGYGLSQTSTGGTMGFNTGDWSGGAPTNAAFRTFTSGLPSLFFGYSTSNTGNNNYLAVNGSTATASTSGVSVTTNSSPLLISREPGGNPFTGSIAEIIMYNADVSSNKNKIESYLAIKYGITLPGNYVAANGTVLFNNATYNNNIAGIGRDDASGLQQRQSQSQNAGVQPIIGNNASLSASNTSGAGNFATDNNFMLWGSDNGSDKIETAFVFGGMNARMGKIWKIQETGTVGTVKVALRKDSFHGTNQRLLVSNDATFDGTDTMIAMTEETIGGIVYYTATVDFSNSQFFSFGSYVAAPGGVYTNLSAWFKADAEAFSDAGVTAAANGSTLQQWNDQSGNAYNLSQATAGDRPVFYNTTAAKLVNFNPSVDYVSTDRLANATRLLPSASPHSFFGVAIDEATNTGYKCVFTADDADGNFELYKAYYYGNGVNGWMGYRGGDYRLVNGANVNNVIGGNGFSPLSGSNGAWNGSTYIENSGTQPQVFGLLGNGTAAASGVSFLDGYKATNTSSAGTPTSWFGRFSVGARTGGGNPFTGRIPEIMTYSRQLTDTEAQKVNTYLAIKYGTTLGQGGVNIVNNNGNNYNYIAADGSTIWNATTNSTYKYGIAGIGRDDASDLYQKQSQSQLSGTQVLIGVGGALANTNSANTNSLSNGQYLVWGDNGLSKTLYNSISGIANINNIFAATWKVQNTGSVATVRVMWPQGITNLKLIQSTDAIFTSSDTITDMSVNTQTVNGVTYNYADVVLTDGQYFTFAGYAVAPGGIVANNQLWLKAGNTIPNTTGNLTNWPNQANINFPFAYTNSDPARVDSDVNFNPAVDFDGDDYFKTDPSTGTLNYTSGYTEGEVFCVTLPATGTVPFPFDFGGYYDSWTGYGGNMYSEFGKTANRLGWNPGTGAVAEGSGTFGVIHDRYSRYNIMNIYSAANDWKQFQDGRQVAATTTNTVGFASNTGGNYIGAITGSVYTGKISEIVLYNRKLTTTERDKVNSYLSLKYGITLLLNASSTTSNYTSSNGSIVWNATTNSSYSNNVAGIGRDDTQGLYQKQSKSSNANTQVIIGTGTTLFNSNASNTNTLTDGQFLVWGDNNGSRKLNTTLNFAAPGGTVNNRMAALWRVQNTNSTGTVIVAWPAGFDNFHLVRSADATITSSDEFIPMSGTVTVKGVLYNTATLTFNNGDYFTFAGLLTSPGGVTGTDFWVKSDNAGNIATAWNDLSATDNDIESVGTWVLTDADADHNFQPYTTGYSTTNFFRDSAATALAASGVYTQKSIGIFSAVRPTSATNGRIVGTDNDINYAAEPYLSIYNNASRFYKYWGNEQAVNGTATATVGKSNLMYWTGNDTTKNLVLGVNGTESTATISGTLGTWGSYLQIGYGTWNLDGAFPGDIMEVIWYNKILTTNESDRINTYLAIRNGVTFTKNYLSSASITVWNRSTNTVYNNNIFGIAKDESGALNQKVSNTVNDINGKIVLSTANNFTASNLDTGRASLTNNQFLLLGDNNNNSSTTIQLDPNDCPALAGDEYRIPRSWLIQNTNTVGSVWLEVNLNAYDINSDVFLLMGDAVDGTGKITTNLNRVYGTISGGKAVFNTVLPHSKYFTVAGKKTAPSCTVCRGGKAILSTGNSWIAGGATARNSNALANLTLSGVPTTGAVKADVSVSYPTNVEWLPTVFPRQYGKFVQLSRYDNVNGATGKVTYKMNLKDASNNAISARPSFQVAGITKISGQTTVVKIVGKCGGNEVTPKLSYAYTANMAYNRYIISGNIATGTQPYYDDWDFATVNVSFDKVVDEVSVEWTVNRIPVTKNLSYLYVGDITYVCDNVIKPVVDNVSMITSYNESTLATCHDATLKLRIKNNNCSSKTINITNTLPSTLQYVASSYVALGSETPIYSGQNFSLTGLIVPPGDSYVYVKVRPTNPANSGTYSTVFNYTVTGGTNNPNPYRSDDDSGAPGYQDTSITYNAAVIITKPVVTKSVNKCFINYGSSGVELTYTITIQNPNNFAITNIELDETFGGNQTYVTGSITKSNFAANGTTVTDNEFIVCDGMTIAPLATATIQYKVNTNDTDADFLSMSKVIVDPQSECGSSNTAYSNELNVVKCTTCSQGIASTWKITAPSTTPAWTNGVPTIETNVTFEADYTAASDIQACSVRVKNAANVIISSGMDYTVFHAITVDAGSNLTFNNNANLLQLTDNANQGNVKFKRDTNPLMRLDYTIWSGPVTGQNLLAFSPLTLTNRFYTYNTSTNLYNAVNATTTSFTPGTGYQIRVPDNHPTTPTVWTGTFTGVPNNGNYTLPLNNFGAGRRFNLVGNPYPSPISMTDFVAANTGNITGTLYFWRKTNSTVTNMRWSTWNSGTFVASPGPEPYVTDPNGVIRNGQGFLVEATANGSNLIFTNTMRNGNNANQFFRSTTPLNAINTPDKSRIWLNATTDSGSFCQMAVSYIDGGTTDLDAYDGKCISTSELMLNSKINNQSDYYTIQSRPLPFDTADIVPLSFKTDIANTFSISIDHLDGLFSDGNQNIFLQDNYNNSCISIINAPYTFSSGAGTFDDRFELRFTANALGTGQHDFENTVIVYGIKGNYNVKSSVMPIKQLRVYDLRGRLIYEADKINDKLAKVTLNTANEVLLIKVLLDNGTSIVKKIIN